MTMATISLVYPETWLSISVVVINSSTDVVDFSWVADEIASSNVYQFSFIEAVDTDYAYVATAVWYTPMSGMIFREGGWLTTDQANQLENTVKKWDMILNLGEKLSTIL